MKRIIAAGLAVVSISCLAKIPNIGMDEIYNRHKSTGVINCEHPNLRAIQTKIVINDHIETSFSIKGFEFNIRASLGNRNMRAELFTDKLKISGVVDNYKKLKFNFKDSNKAQKELVNRYGLKQMVCEVAIYYDRPIDLKTNKVHINVHPHKGYDPRNYTGNAVAKYHADKSYESIVLLDIWDKRHSISAASFIKNGSTEQKSGYVSELAAPSPEHSSVYVAPAGHSLYKIQSNNLDITYTGGNLNYCILNNVRRLIHAFEQYSTGGTLNINYDLNAIVAQSKSWLGVKFRGGEGLGIFAKEAFRKSNSLKNKFHSKMRGKMESDISYKTTYFKTLVYSYVADGKTYRRTLNGSGEGVYQVNINYLNE